MLRNRLNPVITLTILLCFAVLVAADPAKAFIDVEYSETNSTLSWAEQVKKGHTDGGAKIEAKIVEKNGEKKVKEEPNPLKVPDQFKDLRSENIIEMNSERILSQSKNDPHQYFMIILLNDIPAAYIHFNDLSNMVYKARASADADYNFEQVFEWRKFSEIDFQIFYGDYFSKSKTQEVGSKE